MSQIYNQKLKRSKPQDTQLGILKMYAFCRKFSRGPQVQERALLMLRSICPRKYTQKRSGSSKGEVGAQQSHSQVGVNTSSPAVYWRKQPNWRVHLELCCRNHDIRIVLSNSTAHTHASCKTTRTQENFNNRVTKMVLPSDELWLIANNSKSFANGSESIIRNNLGLFKHFEIYLIQSFQKHRSNGIKIWIWQENLYQSN